MRQSLLSKGTAPITTIVVCLVISLSLTPLSFMPHASAATPSNSPVTTTNPDGEGFSLQVSPSPLIATIKPGVTTTLELHIQNTSTKQQDLKMGLKSFTVNETTGQVQLGKTAPSEVSSFVSFSQPIFSVDAGQIMTQQMTIKTPSNAGFTYSFATSISQQNPPKAQGGKSAIDASVAVFTLLSVDRPGAVRKLELSQLSVSKNVYEYLPATISVKFKNTGNTIVQPSGTIFIQRKDGDSKPLAAIQLNQAGGYILPGSSRVLTAKWSDGYPYYKTTTGANSSTSQQLTWGGSDFTKFRIGKYLANVVATYDNGERDVTLNSQISFWVIPWRILLGVLLVVIIAFVGIFTILRKSSRALKRGKKHDVSKKP